jgi:uncharacterized tellurite resistance protein B-like protein
MEAHIMNLYRIMKSDGEKRQSEWRLLFKQASSYGISKERVKYLIDNPHKAMTLPVEDFKELSMRIFDYAMMICIDKKIKHREIEIFKRILQDLGISNGETIKSYIEFGVDFVKNALYAESTPDFDKFINEINNSKELNHDNLGIKIASSANLYVAPENIKLEMPPLEKTLYTFFLLHPKPILIKKMVDHIDDMCIIYHEIKPTTDPEEIKIKLEEQWQHQRIFGKLSKIKREILNKLVNYTTVDSLLIQGSRNQPYTVTVPDSQLIIENSTLSGLYSRYRN